MYPDVLLDLIGQYLDLGSYKQIIDIYPKIFSIKKYHKYQIQYEKIFAEEINIQYRELLLPILELIKKVGKRKIKYFFIKHHYSTIQKIIYVLEYCDIFISQNKNREINILESKTNVFDKCKLSGKITRQFNDLIIINDNVNISYNNHSNNLIINFKNGHYKIENKYLSELYLLYIKIMNEFYRPNDIICDIFQLMRRGLSDNNAVEVIDDFFSLLPDNTIDYEDEYQAFIELVNFRKNEI